MNLLTHNWCCSIRTLLMGDNSPNTEFLNIDQLKPPNQKLGYYQTHTENQVCPQCKLKKHWLYQPHKYDNYSVCSTCFSEVKTSKLCNQTNNM